MTNQATSAGKLKVFLGMCPGVGKTYAMLQAAGELRRQGVDVVAGIIETHGRRETENLLQGLEALPRKEQEYRGTRIGELDIDGLLARRPRLALVDELAHTNAPGARHPKRWQDVAELLEAGIDVYTTVNIQHLESRADVVGAITRAPVRETVPDSFLDRADEIELVDLTPRDLQRRLEEGKVYLGERAAAAAAGFFKESHLTALRQLALRYTAERVGVELESLRVRRRDRATWRTSERFLVAVGPSPFSVALIRRARAMAGALDAPWSAVAVTTDEILPVEDQQRLTENLSLARQLGAEAATIVATGLVEGLLSAARDRGVTQIVIGKSPRHGWRDVFIRPPALRLLQRSGDIDVVAIEPGLPSGSPIGKAKPIPSRPDRTRLFSDIGQAVAMATGLALLCFPMFGILGAQDLAMLMLCGVIVGSLFLLPTGTFALAVLTGLAWNFLFTEPRFSINIRSSTDITMFVALLVASLTMGSLSNRLRRRGLAMERQQMRTARLLEINTILTGTGDTGEAVGACLQSVERLFNLPCTIQLRDERTHELMPPRPEGTLTLDAKQRGIAEWAFGKKQPAGHGTTTLPEADTLHLPLLGRTLAMGVLSIGTGKSPLPLADHDLLEAIAAQLGLGLERNHLLHAIHRAEFLEKGDQLRRTLLDHISHEMRTPVAVMGAGLDALATGAPLGQVLGEMRESQARLRGIVENVIESARVESGALLPKPEWCEPRELAETAIEDASSELDPARVSVEGGERDLVLVDPALLLAILRHLLINAAKHTPSGTAVHIRISCTRPAGLEIRVRDQGPGLIEPESVFERFRKSGATDGLGLGLSICRGIARALGGDMEAANPEVGGAVFILNLPSAAVKCISPDHERDNPACGG